MKRYVFILILFSFALNLHAQSGHRNDLSCALVKENPNVQGEVVEAGVVCPACAEIRRSEAQAKMKAYADAGKKNGEKGENTQEDTDEGGTETKRDILVAYVPKTPTQQYVELQNMAEMNPGLMEDPGFRQKLRYMEVDANRFEETARDVRSGTYGYIARSPEALASYNATNQRIDNATRMVGNIADGVTGIANAIIAAGEEKRMREQAEREEAHRRRMQGIANNKAYVDAVQEARSQFVSEARSRIETLYENYVAVDVKAMRFMAKDYYSAEDVNEYHMTPEQSYIVRDDAGKYGLLDDASNAIYPPQFDVLLLVRDVYENADNNNMIIAKANDRWGVMAANGMMLIPMQYEHIYLLPNFNMILEGAGEFIFVTHGELYINGHYIELGFTTDLQGMKAIFPGGIVPSSAMFDRQSFSANPPSVYYNILNSYNQYTSKRLQSLINLNKQVLWPQHEQATNPNMQVYTASELEGVKAFYKLNNTWYSVYLDDEQGDGLVMIEPTDQAQFIVLDGQETKILNRAGKALYTYDGTLLAPFSSEEQLAPLAGEGYIDKAGEVVIPTWKFASSSRSGEMGEFIHGYAVVEVSYSKYNVIDIQGSKLLDEGISKASAYYKMGMYFYHGSTQMGIDEDKAKAYRYLLKAAEEGSGDAMNNIGVLFMTGQSVEKNVDEAVLWYKKAATTGNSMAAQNLGYYYKSRDKAEAARYFEQAARRNQAAQYELAKLYYDSNNAFYNKSTALKWFKEAADYYRGTAKITADSHYFIGLIYELAERKLARTYFEKAASAGHRLAQAKLDTKVKKNQVAYFEEDDDGDVYLHRVMTFNKDQSPHGVMITYFSNGEIAIIGNYKKGKAEGSWDYYNSSGEHVRSDFYLEGNLLDNSKK